MSTTTTTTLETQGPNFESLTSKAFSSLTLSSPSHEKESLNVVAPLSYLHPDVKNPYYIRDPKPGEVQFNFKDEKYDVLIRNLREQPNFDKEFTLDTAGFELVKDPSFQKVKTSNPREQEEEQYTSDWFSYNLFDSDEQIEAEYYPKVKELLLNHLPGAKEVIIFDHTIRRRNPSLKDQVGKRQPVQSVHIDQSRVAARARVRRHKDLRDKNTLPKTEEEQAKQRFALINVWRPLFDNVQDSPLAFGDYRSIDPRVENGKDFDDIENSGNGDLVVSRLIYPDYDGQTYRLRYNENHKWYYLPNQKVNEVSLIKCYDSREKQKAGGKDVAIFSPHTSFTNPKAGPNARLRESIEIRTLVFY